MEWPKRARTADWENGVLALDREKQFEVPKLTAEIMERLAGYTLVGFHVKGYPVTDELLPPCGFPFSPAPLCQVHDKKIFIFSCPHNPAFLIGILPPPVSVRRQKTHEVAPFLPAAYTQKLCRLFCNKTQSA